MMEKRSSADDDVEIVVKDSSGDDIDEEHDAEEVSSDLPSMTMSSGVSGCSLYASLQLSSAARVPPNDGRNVALALVVILNN